MKWALFLSLLLVGRGEPMWIPRGTPVPAGLVRVQINDCCGSMKPAIQGGEIAFAEIVTPWTVLKVGDIVDTGVHTHRITALNERAVLTSGDNNRWADGWTLRKDLKFVIRYVQRP